MCDRVILVRAGHFNLGNIGNFQLQRCVRLSVDCGIPFARVCSSLFYIIECFIAGTLSLPHRHELEAIAWNVGAVQPNGEF